MYGAPVILDFLFQHIGLVILMAASGLMIIWPDLQNFGKAQATLSTLEATQLINQKHAIVIDLRRKQDFELGHLPGARHIPSDEIASRAEELSRFKARPAILVATGQNGAKAAKALKAQGFEDVFTLKGGMSSWVEANLPIEHSTEKA